MRVRRAVGRTLRDLRSKRQLSLDDIETLTRQAGIRVTRSHLSRVETGLADIALPRFLSLLRALGEPPSHAATVLDALIDPASCGSERLHSEVRRLLQSGDPARAARACRAAYASRRPLTSAVRALWASAESRLGCWSIAERALRESLPHRLDRDAPVLRLAVVSLGAGRTGVAVALARAAGRGSPLSRLVEAACRLSAGEQEEAGRIASRIAIGDVASEQDHDMRGLALCIAAESYRRAGHRRSALRTAERSTELAKKPGALAESLLLHARCLGSLRRPVAGLRLLARARTQARGASIPALLGAVHAEARQLWLLAGDRGAARASARAAQAVLRRHGADRPAPGAPPLHGIFDEIMESADDAAQEVAGTEATVS
ncbi:MAG: helix-turn-helix domain-containing protein [Acidobacteriota bacterium]|nr:helix-turn-helix domain-containing protein [Acidobacteriota bacterium]